MADLSHWVERPRPSRIALDGRFTRLEPLDIAHGKALAASLSAPDAISQYEYLADEPPKSPGDVEAWTAQMAQSEDPFFYAVIEQCSGAVQGRLALMRIEPKHGAVELGSVLYAPAIQRSPVTTECVYLVARYVFETLGYRRLEWKCNARNERSRRAAIRFGFRYEGEFRQHMVVKGANRDTLWFSMLHGEWPERRKAFEAWLAPDNFDASGQQRRSLSAF